MPLGRSQQQQRIPLSYSHPPLYRAVLVDAAGTILMPSEPVADVYLRYAAPYGCRLSGQEVLQRFRRAYNTPWEKSPLRYVGDARIFWHHIVAQSTGCDRPEVSEAIYDYYSTGKAWYLAPGAREALQRLRSHGVLLGIVSNFDTRLRPILRDLGAEDLFDAVVVSAEVRAEKPNPIIFEDAVQRLNAVAMRRGTAAASALHAALPMLSHNPAQPATSPFFSTSSTRVSSSSSNSTSSSCGPAHGSPTSSYGKEGYDFGPLLPEQILHVGDDRRNDVWGARDAGISAWLWGYDVRSWAEVADRVLLGSQAEEYYDALPDALRG